VRGHLLAATGIALLLLFGNSACSSSSPGTDDNLSCREAYDKLLDVEADLNYCTVATDCMQIGSPRDTCECAGDFFSLVNSEALREIPNVLDALGQDGCSGTLGGYICDSYPIYGAIECLGGQCVRRSSGQFEGCFHADCNPANNVGCGTGEKCGQLTESEDPYLTTTRCLPDGTVGEGEACIQGEAGAATGFDNCVGGLDCNNGICKAICDLGPPDGCRSESEAFGEGFYCQSYNDVFSDNVGLCEPACHPLDESVVDGVVSNGSCSDGTVCTLNSSSGTSACIESYSSAAEQTQNEGCFGPPSGGCYRTGCASGFAPLLNNTPTDASETHCARYCSPANTHAGAGANAEGNEQRCGGEALTLLGGTGDVPGSHQCRFVQSFYANSADTPAEVGMCVPVIAENGESWGDCELLDWDGIRQAWNDALIAGTSPEEAFNEHCLVTPGSPATSATRDICLGFSKGCLSLAEIALGLPAPQ